MSSFLDLHAGSLELEPLVTGTNPESSDAATAITETGDGVNESDGVRENAAGRPEPPAALPPQPAAPATRRRRLVNLAEGQIVSRHCMKRSRNY